jgi:hypothetical protein
LFPRPSLQDHPLERKRSAVAGLSIQCVARLLISLVFATVLFLPVSADARVARSRHAHVSSATTDPVALAVHLAEQYWHGVPVCGAPKIVTSPGQLPNSAYETVTSPEPADSVVEMWTEVQDCTITINASLWPSWRQDDESFQWFCDAMTHEVGHLFGHLDAGQTNPASIAYPFLDAASPNFDAVPECRAVTLQYGSEQIRDEEVLHRP